MWLPLGLLKTAVSFRIEFKVPRCFAAAWSATSPAVGPAIVWLPSWVEVWPDTPVEKLSCFREFPSATTPRSSILLDLLRVVQVASSMLAVPAGRSGAIRFLLGLLSWSSLSLLDCDPQNRLVTPGRIPLHPWALPQLSWTVSASGSGLEVQPSRTSRSGFAPSALQWRANEANGVVTGSSTVGAVCEVATDCKFSSLTCFDCVPSEAGLLPSPCAEGSREKVSGVVEWELASSLPRALISICVVSPRVLWPSKPPTHHKCCLLYARACRHRDPSPGISTYTHVDTLF